MAQARIGVTRGGSAERLSPTYQKYHDRLIEAGAATVDLHPACLAEIEQHFAGLDALLLTGGADVRPERYGATPDPRTDAGQPERDALELRLTELALTRDLPVLAICRGQQLLNVAMGGGLLQHIEGDAHRALDDGAGESRWHEIAIEEGSLLHRVLTQRRMEANSRHHQAVTLETLAPGLRSNAVAPDGIVEGLESVLHRWVLAVQWHPERPEVMERFRPLFTTFVHQAELQRALRDVAAPV